jgi:hypothetical protein
VGARGGVALGDLLPVAGRQPDRLDVAAGVVEVVAGARSIPRTAPTISEPNRMLSTSTTSNRRSMPGWW